MLGLIREIVDWIGPLFQTAGYVIIAVGVLAERSILLGLVVPGDVIIALGGVYAARGELNVVAVIAIAFVAAVCGESIGFWLGRKFGMRLIRRLPFVNRVEGKLEDVEDYFARHGGKTVAIGRYATAAGAMVPFVAGMAGMPYRRFLLFDVPAVLLWAIGITMVGYVFGRNLDLVETILSRFGWGILGILVAFVVGRFVWKRVRSGSGSGPGDGEGRTGGDRGAQDRSTVA
jgi:membrane protein DedA with SNARE-associated domain